MVGASMSGYRVALDGRAVTLEAPGLGTVYGVLRTDDEARRVARACRLDVAVARAAWWYFRVPSVSTRAAVKAATVGWRERVIAALLLALYAPICAPMQPNAWREHIRAENPSAVFGHSSCGRFDLAFLPQGVRHDS